MKKAKKLPPKLPAEAFTFEEDVMQNEASEDEIAGVQRLMDPQSIKKELFELIESGKVDFDVVEAMQDKAFIRLLVEMPAEYAVRVYQAEKKAENAQKEAMIKLAQRLKKREEMPKASRAGSGSVPAWDYANMPDEQFEALERHLKQQAQRGIHVKL